MTPEELREKKELQKKLKSTGSIIFDDEKFPIVKKDIEELLEELNKEIAETRRIIAENDKKILDTMSYEELFAAIQSFRQIRGIGSF